MRITLPSVSSVVYDACHSFVLGCVSAVGVDGIEDRRIGIDRAARDGGVGAVCDAVAVFEEGLELLV